MVTTSERKKVKEKEVIVSRNENDDKKKQWMRINDKKEGRKDYLKLPVLPAL